MHRIILSFISLAILLAACNSKPTTELHAPGNVAGTAVYGDSIINDNIIELSALQTAMKDENKRSIKIKGIVSEVCQKEGCWMMMKLNNGEEMRVTFKDYKFFVPKDLAGKEVILDGFAYMDTTSIEDLIHYAKDAGKSEAEIADITDPKPQIAYQASGVAVMN